AYRLVQALEVCGLHDRAARLLNTIVQAQTKGRLSGRYIECKGAFSTVPAGKNDRYRKTGSILNHVYAIWMLNEHYRFTRDRKWLAGVADNLIAACDWVIGQRKIGPEDNLLAKDDPYWGEDLLPPGALEDEEEWFWWFSADAYACRGMQATADSLAEIGHGEAKRIADEGRAYSDRLGKSCKESMIRSPVVRLDDGTYVPRQPMRSRFRGAGRRMWRDRIYGPVHLLECGIYADESPEAEWILRDMESNPLTSFTPVTTAPVVYMTKSYREGLGTLRRFGWGLNASGNRDLLPASLVYLRRGQANHAIPFFDSGLGGHMRSPYGAECVVWLRNLLILENGKNLDLLAGVPGSWLVPGKQIEVTNAPTWYGPMDMHVESLVDGREVKMLLTGPRRNPPETIRLYLRTPAPIKTVMVNGESLSTFAADKGIVTLPGGIGHAVIAVSY
ncbi:MAG: hypothetical protein ACYTF1_19140, partial [Planctomycetota bacterium]